MLPSRVQLLEGHAREGRREARDLVHDLRRMRVVHALVAQRLRELHGDFPVGQAAQRLHHLAHERDAALGIGEGAVLLQEGRSGEEHMRVLGGLVQEQVLHHHAFHRRKTRGDMLGVGIGLRRILALDVEGLEAAVERGLEHVGNAQARLRIDRHAPLGVELVARHLVGQMPVAGQLMRERAHVAGALHVVLAAQRIHAHAFAAEVAGGHGEVGDAHHHGAALAVLGDAEAVVDGAIAAGGITDAPHRAPVAPARR